jgi:hypothetical protein
MDKEKYIVYWIFRIAQWGITEGGVELLAHTYDQEHFEKVGAPAWAWPAYQEIRDRLG